MTRRVGSGPRSHMYVVAGVLAELGAQTANMLTNRRTARAAHYIT